MLVEISLTDFGVVAATSFELRPGLIAVTGETGAGKTMIVSGLGQLLGQRADAGVVRTGAEKAIVRGRWLVDTATARAVAELGGDCDDDELTTVRQIAANGRSRATIGGSPVPVSRLVGLELATIHGQSEQLRLATAERQRELLDAYAHTEGLSRYKEAFEERALAAAELEQHIDAAQARAREQDMLHFGIAEIERIAPEPGEDQALADEQRRLLELDDLRELATRAGLGLSGDDSFEQPGAVGLVGEARKALGHLADKDTAAAALAERAEEASLIVGDLAASVAGYLADLVADPARLEAVSARRAELATLTRKYGDTVDDVLRWAAEASERLLLLQGTNDRIEILRARLACLDDELRTLADQISAQRSHAAARLADAARVELEALAMPNARLQFAVTPTTLGPHGGDAIELLFSANPGSASAPLRKVASGGELSRVRLALEVVLADAPGHTFVFDEVDAGVGGAVGLEIGRRLQRLASSSQVIVVTHLAQVAAFADQHLVVRKSSEGEVTISGVHEVTGEERVAELARMMSGHADTDAALEHARELLVGASRALD